MRDRLRLYADLAKWPALALWWGAAALACLRVLGARAGLPWPDTACQSPYCDLSAFWQAARMAAAGHAVQAYDPALFLAARAALLGHAADALTWYYPPPALIAVAGLAGLPLGAAFWVWTAALSALAVLLLRAAGWRGAVIAAGLLSPASLWNAELGQFGALTGAALVAGLSAARPLGAGLTLGLLVIKPQAGLLAPVALLAAGRWRALLVAAGVALAGAGASLALFGPAVWRAYLGPGLALSHAMLIRLSVTPGTAAFGVSVFGMLRSFGAASGVAAAGQAAALLFALLAALRLWRGPPSPRRVYCTCLLALLATPYGYVDDMVGVSLALAAACAAEGWRFSLLDVLVFTWPALCPAVYQATGWQVTPLLLGLALWRSGAAAPPGTAPAATGRAAGRAAAG
jgi:hypothetical protein